MKCIFNNKFIPAFSIVVLLLIASFAKANTSPLVYCSATDSIPADPAIPNTIGFFMDNWLPKDFKIPAKTVVQPLTKSPATITVLVKDAEVLTKIAPNYYGNNSNLWCGQFNTKSTLVNHLINYQPQILRGPAGSVSDLFFFDADNRSTPASGTPDSLVDAKGVKTKAYFWFGKDNSEFRFSIDGYYDLLKKTNSTGLLTMNYGYARYGTSTDPVAAAAHLAANWVRYDKGRTKYWEIGNENYGDWEAGYRIDTTANRDGQPQIVTGALYGKHFKVFADSMRKAAMETGYAIKIGALLYETVPPSWSTHTTKTWNDGYFASAGDMADFYAVHSYFTPFKKNTDAAGIFTSATSVPGEVKNYVTNGLKAAGLSIKPIAMTEWNLFCAGSKQNVSNIAGMHAVITMGEFIKNNYGASIRWDLANAWDNGEDHGLFNNGSEPGVATWAPRPAFYYMYYFQKTIGDRLLASTVTGQGSEDIVSIATSFSSGQKGVVLVNKGTAKKTVEINFQQFNPGRKFYFYTLEGGGDNGEFSRKVFVNGNGPASKIAGGPAETYTSIKMYSTAADAGIKVTMPARSVVYLVADKK